MYVCIAVASNQAVSDPACGRKLGTASWIISVTGIVISIIVGSIVAAVVVQSYGDVWASNGHVQLPISPNKPSTKISSNSTTFPTLYNVTISNIRLVGPIN